MSTTVVVKSGWLQRQKHFTKKWKPYWFVLYKNGLFRYFPTQHMLSHKDEIIMPTECLSIKVGSHVHARAHEMLSPDFLLSIETRSGKIWILCGETLDDTIAWQTALEQAQDTTAIVMPQGSHFNNTYYPRSPGRTRTVVYPGQGTEDPNGAGAGPGTYFTGPTTVVYPPPPIPRPFLETYKWNYDNNK